MTILDIPAVTIGSVTLSPAFLLGLAAAVLLLPILIVVIVALRGARARTEMREDALRRDEAAEARLAELLKAQAEMQGRLATMAEVFGSRQAELNQSISQRLDGMTHRLGTTITEQTKSTHDNLRTLQERLAVKVRSLAPQT